MVTIQDIRNWLVKIKKMLASGASHEARFNQAVFVESDCRKVDVNDMTPTEKQSLAEDILAVMIPFCFYLGMLPPGVTRLLDRLVGRAEVEVLLEEYPRWIVANPTAPEFDDRWDFMVIREDFYYEALPRLTAAKQEMAIAC